MLRRGMYQSFGLALVGLALAVALAALLSPLQTTHTSTRVGFSFPGFEHGEYPDKSKFQPDDILAPRIISAAMQRIGISTDKDLQNKIRNALQIEGIIPDTVVKNRDKLRSLGQAVPAYLPDEYLLTLTLSRSFPLSKDQREKLILEIVNVAVQDFKRNFGELPIAFGSAFEALRSADLPEYEIVFNAEMDSLNTYLTAQIATAKAFRSPTTNLSFEDLQEQAILFSRIRLNVSVQL